jgi:hypothetical protein
MRRLLWVCSSIVAAFPLHLAAAAPIEQVPVTPPVAAVAERFGVDVARARAQFVPEIIRLIYSVPPSRFTPLNIPAPPRGAPATGPLVDLPLPRSVWTDVVLRRQVPIDQLLAAILTDRRAALLCRGLAAADDETLAFYEAHPALLAFVYEHAPGAFASYASSFTVHGGRIVLPGGDAAEPLWRAVTHQSPAAPEAFLRALLVEPEARLAYLFDVLTTAQPASRAFALGSWIDDEGVRLARFQALAAAVHVNFREWHVEELPFARPLNDLAILLLRIVTDDHGQPQAPARRQFWAAALDASPALDTAAEVRASAHPLIDAAWLVQATTGDMYSRGDKLDQIAFGQRVFRAAPDTDAVAAVIREMPTRRMLLLGLERIGIRNPDVYESALRKARATLDGGAARFWTLAQLQSALAIVERMERSQTIDRSQAEALCQSLFAVPLTDGAFRGQLADWYENALGPRMLSGSTWEARTIVAIAGGPTPGHPEVEWEGQTYRLDLAYAERRRMQQVRSRQGGPSVDVGLQIARLAARVKAATSIEVLRAAAADVQHIVADNGADLARPSPATFAPGVTPPRDPREWLTRIAEDLERDARAGDLRRAARSAEALTEVADIVLGHAMLSMAYAMHLGDPEGPALLGANVALRHDFGLSRTGTEGRARGPWAQPRQDFNPGVPWHVAGSVIGLDVALAPLSLHRLTLDGLATPPPLSSIEREAFAVNVAMLNGRELTDIGRDRVAVAIERGRARVGALARNPADLDRVTDEIALDGWRGRTVRWVLQNDPDSIENQFSLAELLVLGGPEAASDEWGANGLVAFGCLCIRFPEPRTWRILTGRPQFAMLAATNVEMNLEMAQRLSALRLPASLLPAILATAMQDFVDNVAPTDANDTVALRRYVRAMSRNAVADYIAATATLDGPLVSPDAAADELVP